MTKDGPIRGEMFVGDILKNYPALRDRIRDVFGSECLQCRSNQKETLIYTSWHKGLDPNRIVRELNAALAKK